MFRSLRIAAAALACLLWISPSISLAAQQPNIIFILADDLGYGDLGCFGQQNFDTPHLDQMSRDGMKLTQHYAGSTVCAPSRACLLTGTHTGHVFQRFNGNIEFREDPLDMTVAKLLKDAGYHTAMIGKSGLSCRSDDPSMPNRKGFDHFFGYISHGAAHRYYPNSLFLDGTKVIYPNNQGKEGDQYSGDLFLKDALDYLELHAGQPFFLHLSLQQPHADLAVPDEWKEPFLDKFEDEPFAGNGYRAEEHPKATFAGMVTYLDDTVGQIREKLEELGIAGNTLIVFSSDNGAMSEGGWSRKNFNSSGPLRGGKRDMYEGGIRVPTIACWPGKIEPGSESAHISAFWDFLPTACDVAGAETPDDIDGISYLPTLLGEGDQPEHEYLYWEFYEQGGKQAVRWGDWKGVRLNVSTDRNAPLELYDLASDVGETNNVASEHPDVVKKLAELMDEAHVDSPIIRFGGQKGVKPAEREES